MRQIGWSACISCCLCSLFCLPAAVAFLLFACRHPLHASINAPIQMLMLPETQLLNTSQKFVVTENLTELMTTATHSSDPYPAAHAHRISTDRGGSGDLPVRWRPRRKARGRRTEQSTTAGTHLPPCGRREETGGCTGGGQGLPTSRSNIREYSSRGLSLARDADSAETGGGERALSDERLRRPGRRLSRIRPALGTAMSATSGDRSPPTLSSIYTAATVLGPTPPDARHRAALRSLLDMLPGHAEEEVEVR